MARAPDERVNKAYELYKSGMKLVEIASQLNIPDGTVRRWKSTYKWGGERSEKKANKKSERSVKKKNEVKPIAKEVKQVIENAELTDKQRLFCLHYIKCFNATKAYQKAYEVDEKTAASIAYRLMENDGVRNEIQRLKQGKLNKAMLEPGDIFQKYMDIAFADMNDYVTYGTKEVTMSNSEGLEATVEMSYVDVNSSWLVDGSLISEISKGKGGIKIKLADKMKALDWIANHMDMATTEQKARIEHLKNKDKLDRERFEHDKEINSKKYW